MALANWLKKGLVVLLLLLSAFSVLAITPSRATSPPSSGQILWFKFDDASGSTATDSSGNGNTGNLDTGSYGSPTWTTGKTDGGLSFTASSSTAVIIPSTTLGFGASSYTISVCAWIKPTSVTGDEGYIEHGVPGQAGYWNLFNSWDGAHFNLRFYIGTDVSADSSFVVGQGDWTHVCTTYDGQTADQIVMYFNGTNPQTFTGKLGAIGSSIYDVRVGGYAFGGGDYTGLLDDVIVYNRVLTPSDVDAIYSYTSSSSTTTSTASTVTTTVTSTVTSTTTSTVTSVSPTTTTATVTSTAVSTVTSPSTVTSTSTVTSDHTATSTITTTSTVTTTVTSTVISATTTHIFERNITIDGSNTTILDWQFTGNGVNITIIGPANTTGYLHVVIPKTFIGGTPMVLIDDGAVAPLSYAVTGNSTCWILDVWYSQSAHTIAIMGNIPIPENQTPILLLIASLVSAMIVVRRRKVV